ncbi:MAG: TonB family protein, partial [Zetaproteobacteria bacterium]|nr:TonB family protein [Zetaproteobacteria bacterium]
ADEGIRHEDVDSYAQDLSSEAQIILQAPLQLTEEALDAEIEGEFKVDVYVALDGSVLEAELTRPVGYGMDERIITTAQNSKFRPATNKYGKPIASWAIMTVRFEIE